MLKNPARLGQGFFMLSEQLAAMTFGNGRGQAVVLRNFSSSEALADYAQGVRLPGE